MHAWMHSCHPNQHASVLPRVLTTTTLCSNYCVTPPPPPPPTQASGQAPSSLQAKLPAYLKDAEAFVSEGLGTDAEPQPRQQTLGELLLGLPPPAAAAQQSHLSDAGLVLDHEPYPAPSAAAAAAAARQLLGQPPAAEEQPQQQQARSEQQGQQQQQEGQQQQQQEGQGTAEEPDQESIAAMLQESLLQAGGSNRAELEAMLLRCAAPFCQSLSVRDSLPELLVCGFLFCRSPPNGLGQTLLTGAVRLKSLPRLIAYLPAPKHNGSMHDRPPLFPVHTQSPHSADRLCFLSLLWLRCCCCCGCSMVDQDPTYP
jgi:hypothetical protein